MSTHRWPFAPDIAHDPKAFPCVCQPCRERRAAGAARSMRRSRRDMERWTVDPQYLKDRKR